MFREDLFLDDKYCSECGSRNIDLETEERFCRECGTVVDERLFR